MNPKRILPLVLALLLSGGAAAQELPIGGPIPIRNDFPLQVIHLSFLPQSGAVLDEGESKLSATGVWSNTNIIADNFSVDSESADTTVELRRGIGDGAELSAAIPPLWRGGGTLDSAIDDWHKIWGLPRGARDRTENNQFNIEGVRRDARGFKIKDDGFSPGNLILGGKYQVLHQGDTTGSLIAELSLPRFGGTYGHDGLDAVVGAAFTSAFSWTALHYGGAAVMNSDREYDGIPYTWIHAEGFVNAEIPIAGKVEFLAGLYGGTKTVEQVTGYPDYFTYLDVGFRFQLPCSSALSFNVRENPTPHDGTTDVSFVAAVEHAWR